MNRKKFDPFGIYTITTPSKSMTNQLNAKRKKRDILHTILGFVILILCAYGLVSLCMRLYNVIVFVDKKPYIIKELHPRAQLSPTLGRPGDPLYDPSEMKQVLIGIERELKRMNDIQERVHNPTGG